MERFGVPDARKLRTHDLRRGCSQDLLDSGANLAEILQAGEWRSSAFTTYLEMDSLEDSAVLQAFTMASSDEEDGEDDASF